jgi:MFS family permease
MKKLPIVEKRYVVAFALTSTLFFAWGLASQFNDLLLHHFQKALDLTRTRASLTQFAFYIGYFCAPLPAALIIRRLGYKKTIIIGLALYAIGAFLFVPAAQSMVYSWRRFTSLPSVPDSWKPAPTLTSPFWARPKPLRPGSILPKPLTASPPCWDRWSAAM